MVKRLKLICVQIISGEKHYVVQSLESNENPANCEDFDEVKIRGNMKEEAARQLLLLRSE